VASSGAEVSWMKMPKPEPVHTNWPTPPHRDPPLPSHCQRLRRYSSQAERGEEGRGGKGMDGRGNGEGEWERREWRGPSRKGRTLKRRKEGVKGRDDLRFTTCLQLFRSFLIGLLRLARTEKGLARTEGRMFPHSVLAVVLVCALLLRRRCASVAALSPGRPHCVAVRTDRAAPPLPLRRLRCAAAVTADAAPLSEPAVLSHHFLRAAFTVPPRPPPQPRRRIRPPIAQVALAQ
jgi:hypothetical protein